MEKPISVGDLVQIIRPRGCCPQHSKLGGVFTVTGVRSDRPLECCYCKRLMDVAHAEFSVFPDLWVEVSRLKRVPPLEELDNVKREETADA